MENLETLRWKPEDQPADLELTQYLSVAKAVYLISRLLDAEDNPPTVTSTDCEMETTNVMEEEITSRETPSTTPLSINTSTSSTSISIGTSFSTLNKPKLLPTQPKSHPKTHQHLNLEGLSHAEETKSPITVKEKSTLDDQYEDVDKNSDANWEDSTEYLRTALKGLVSVPISHCRMVEMSAETIMTQAINRKLSLTRSHCFLLSTVGFYSLYQGVFSAKRY